MKNLFDLTDKVAIITGGASGIGRATVQRFVAEGAKVVIADLNQDDGQALADELGANATFIPVDVSQEAQIQAMITHALDSYGQLDILFNNAGYGGVSGPIEEIDVTDYDATMNVLLKMKAQRSGSIISTASVAGLRTGMGPTIYSAAKAAVIHMTRAVAAELGPFGIRVNAICPGAIPTPIFLGGAEVSPAQREAAVNLLSEHFTHAQPLNRAAKPDDIAAAALYLASDDGSFVSGHALVVDGSLIYGEPWNAENNIATQVAQSVMEL